jgi:hypothetical protein
MFSNVSLIIQIRKFWIARNDLMDSAATKQPRVRDYSLQPGDGVRRRVLARLQEHRSAVDQLIGALERYQKSSTGWEANSRPLPLAEKSS